MSHNTQCVKKRETFRYNESDINKIVPNSIPAINSVGVSVSFHNIVNDFRRYKY